MRVHVRAAMVVPVCAGEGKREGERERERKRGGEMKSKGAKIAPYLLYDPYEGPGIPGAPYRVNHMWPASVERACESAS